MYDLFGVGYYGRIQLEIDAIVLLTDMNLPPFHLPRLFFAPVSYIYICSTSFSYFFLIFQMN